MNLKQRIAQMIYLSDPRNASVDFWRDLSTDDRAPYMRLAEKIIKMVEKGGANE
jgi:hypothetical protein